MFRYNTPLSTVLSVITVRTTYDTSLLLAEGIERKTLHIECSAHEYWHKDVRVVVRSIKTAVGAASAYDKQRRTKRAATITLCIIVVKSRKYISRRSRPYSF